MDSILKGPLMSEHVTERKRPTASAPNADPKFLKRRVKRSADHETLSSVVAIPNAGPAAVNMQKMHSILHASEDLIQAVAHLSAADNREWPAA